MRGVWQIGSDNLVGNYIIFNTQRFSLHAQYQSRRSAAQSACLSTERAATIFFPGKVCVYVDVR